MALCEGFAALLFVAFGAGCCAYVSGEDAVQSRQDRVIFAACHVDGSGVGSGFEDFHDLRDGVVQLVRDGTQRAPGGVAFFGQGFFEGCER